MQIGGGNMLEVENMSGFGAGVQMFNYMEFRLILLFSCFFLIEYLLDIICI